MDDKQRLRLAKSRIDHQKRLAAELSNHPRTARDDRAVSHAAKTRSPRQGGAN